MLWTLLLAPFRLFILFIISLLPHMPTITNDLSLLIGFIRKGLYFTHVDIFISCIALYVTMELSLLSWNVVRFIYSKIPFLNIR